ncbi:MAG: flippase-like domain-containing protein [Armatimonadetes bacterium]|nr:flippase-like domain-containing protein [Armatimonadota bacterium]
MGDAGKPRGAAEDAPGGATGLRGARPRTSEPPSHPTTQPPRRRWKWIARGALGAATLAFLYGQARGGEVARALAGVDVGLWVGAVGLYLAGQLVCAWKWGLLARPLGMRRPYRALVAYYFGGMFANLFLPTIIGGDAVRALALSRPDGSLGRAAVTVLADRGSGFVALLLLAAVAAVCVPGVPAWLAASAVGAAALVLIGGAGAFAAPERLRRLGMALADALLAWRAPATWVPVFLIALVFQGLIIGVHALLGRALGLGAPLGIYALAGTLTAVVAMAPVSINGLGTRDAAYVFFLGMAGVPREAALAFALAWLALLLVCGGLGGAVVAVLAPDQIGLFTRRRAPGEGAQQGEG